MKIGLIIGRFLPLHNGSLTLCKVAERLSDKLIIIIVNSPDDQIPIRFRVSWLKKEIPNAIVIDILQYGTKLKIHQLKEVLHYHRKKLGYKNFHLFSSDASMLNFVKSLNLKYTVLDPERLGQNIQSKEILANPYDYWSDIPISVRRSLIRRVVLIGPESVGKSTLANHLRKSLTDYPFLPEYGRPYEVFRSIGPYKDHEFEEIIAVHAAHREALLPFSGPVFIEDTDELTTAVWVEMLMGKIMSSVENKITLPFTYLLLDTSVPFKSEKIRYFENEKRLEFFNKIKAKLDFYNASYVLIKGSWSNRQAEAEKIVMNAFKKNIDWSKLRD